MVVVDDVLYAGGLTGDEDVELELYAGGLTGETGDEVLEELEYTGAE